MDDSAYLRTGPLSKREVIALEFAKIFIQAGWEAPLTNAVQFTNELLLKLEMSAPKEKEEIHF